MKKTREIYILAILVVFLGAFIYFYERHTTTTEERERRSDKVLRDFKRERISKIQIKSSEAEIVLLKQLEKSKEKKEKESGELSRWKILKPWNANADNSTVDGILSELEFLSYERKVEGKEAQKVAKFGLDKPNLTIKFVEGRKTFTLLFGKTAPHEGVYLQIAENPLSVYVVSKSTFESFKKDPVDFRNKQLVDLLPESLSFIKLFDGTGVKAQFEKTGGKWYASGAEMGSEKIRVAGKEVRKLGSELGSLTAVNFISDSPDENKLKESGIDKDSLTAEIKDSSGNTVLIQFGKECGGETKGSKGIAAYVKGSKTLACIKQNVQPLLNRRLSEYRLMNPVEFDEFELDAFEVYEGENLSFRIEKFDTDKWQLTKPEKQEVDSETVNGFIDFLKNEKISSFLLTDLDINAANPGQKNPFAKFTFFDSSEKKLETLLFAHTSNGSLYFRREDEKSWGKINEDSPVKNSWKIFYYYKKNIVSENYYDAVRFSVEGKSNGFYHKLVKDKEKSQWNFEVPSSIPADSSDVRETIETFASLSAQKFLAFKSEDSMKNYGLQNPHWKVKAVFSGKTENSTKEGEEKGAAKSTEKGSSEDKGERIYELMIGNQVEEGFAAYLDRYAHPVVFLISKPVYERLTRHLCDRSIFQIDSSSIKSVLLAKGGKTEEFERKDDKYIHRSGLEKLFEEAKVNEFIEKLTATKAEDVVCYGEPLREHGLSKPVLKIQLSISGEQQVENNNPVFVFGAKMKKSDNKEYIYAMKENVPCIYLVESDIFKKLGL